MSHLEKTLSDFDLDQSDIADAGFFTWDIHQNIICGDSAFAELYGIDPILAESGLPLSDYLDRIHPDDLPQLTKVILDTVANNRNQNETYRVKGTDNRYRTVMSFGRAFRDHRGEPATYVGMVIAYEHAEYHGVKLH